MERRGCTGLRYALTILIVLRDGTLDERTLVRQPYAEPQHADEFLRYLRGGPDAAVWKGDGPPPGRSGSPEGASPVGAALGEPGVSQPLESGRPAGMQNLGHPAVPA